jgi:hypothetical protein
VCQLVIVICVVIIAIANKSGNQSEPSSCYQSHYPSVARDNTKIDLAEIEWGDVDWVGLAQDRDESIVLMNAVMKLWVP